MSANGLKIGRYSFGKLELIKLMVYSALTINFFLYIGNDIEIARHTLYEGSSFLERTRAFATTIDLSAWFILLFLLELETYWLSEDSLSRVAWMVIRGIRGLCILFLAHTLYAYGVYLTEIYSAPSLEGVSNLCQLVGADKSYALNLAYSEITAENCVTLSSANQFYFIDPPTFFIVQDAAGLMIEKELAWVDMVEAIVWIVILLIIEIMIRIQDKNISTGAGLVVLSKLKILLFIVLWMAALYWLYRDHFMFAWDEFLWIAGFYVIGLNLSEWREEINENNSREPTQSV